jgi:hypothetical protein
MVFAWAIEPIGRRADIARAKQKTMINLDFSIFNLLDSVFGVMPLL